MPPLHKKQNLIPHFKKTSVGKSASSWVVSGNVCKMMIVYVFKDTILIWLRPNVCLYFYKNRREPTMGDEDWEAEIIKPHVSSYVPVFEKVVKFKVCSY